MPEFQPGDKIRYKKLDNEVVRTNGALDLVLLYYGSEHVIYGWSNPDRPNGSGGEVHVSRAEFDRDCELVPEGFEEGVMYRHRNPLGPQGVFECVFADDQVAVLADRDTRIFRNQDTASLWVWVEA